MLKKGHTPSFTRQESNMRRVLGLVEQGMVDRDSMAEMLKISRNQVDNALLNLLRAGIIEVHTYTSKGGRRGRDFTIYRAKGCIGTGATVIYQGISFVFWAGNALDKSETGR